MTAQPAPAIATSAMTVSASGTKASTCGASSFLRLPLRGQGQLCRTAVLQMHCSQRPGIVSVPETGHETGSLTEALTGASRAGMALSEGQTTHHTATETAIETGIEIAMQPPGREAGKGIGTGTGGGIGLPASLRSGGSRMSTRMAGVLVSA